MGLTNWSGDKVRKQDVTVAKNYLLEDETRILNLLVGQCLDFAELQAQARRERRMANWIAKFDDILRLNDVPVLQGLGSVTKTEADSLAEAQYGAFESRRRQAEADAIDGLAELERAAKQIEKPTPRKARDTTQ